MSDEKEKEKETPKDISDDTGKERKSIRVLDPSVSFFQKDDEANAGTSPSKSNKEPPNVAPKPRKPSIRVSVSEPEKDTVHKKKLRKNRASQNHLKPIKAGNPKQKMVIQALIKRDRQGSKHSIGSVHSKSHLDDKNRQGSVARKSYIEDKNYQGPVLRQSHLQDRNLQGKHQERPSSGPQKYNEREHITYSRRRREPFDGFDKEKYLADMIDYERSSETNFSSNRPENRENWMPDSALRHRFGSRHKFNTTSSLLDEEGEEEDPDLYSIGSSTMKGSTRSHNDDRSTFLAEIINMGKLKELKDQRVSTADYLKQRRADQTIDEIKGSKTTGTGRNHVDEIKWKETFSDSSDDDDDARFKNRGTITKIFCLAQRAEENPKENEDQKEDNKDVSKDKKPPTEPEIELEAKKPWSFPITETFSEIPGEKQTLDEKKLIKIGKRNRKIRAIGVNTYISRKPQKVESMPGIEEGIIHDDGKLRDIGQVTERRHKHRNYKYKTETDDQPIEIGPLDDRVREIGVNTKVLPKTKDPPISEMYEHPGNTLRNFGTNTDKPFRPIDDGTEVIYSTPFKYDEKKLNDLIVDPPIYDNPYKLPTKDEGRPYYKGCEYHFPGRTGWRRLFYNNTYGKYELRRGSHWFYTLIFAICYIAFVVLFSMAWFDYLTNDATNDAPKSKMHAPVMTFTPIGPRTNPKGISFDPQNETETMEKNAAIMALLEKYGDSGHNFRFGPCNAHEKFGYPSGEPCVFLKVNRIIGFRTEPYVDSDELVNAKVSEDEFLALRSLLENATSKEDRENRTWITCQTEENKNIQIEFHPEAAIRTEYTDIKEKIEYVGDKNKKSFFGPNDLNRVVALKIKNLKPNERIYVKCKMWAHNIKHNQKGFGQVSFYVLLATDRNREKVEKVLRYHETL
ncbi:LOW QUALITY PROTEIN: uncharacterized protein LOC108101732 [Drosophila ficusphila]|uniref:LOW QUALITY PROTEIN: uncharacterized protein LOC108101732 n=1 Tax=Drosophila ficusphila TaxID=30025 RepID=UPI001C8A6275|nr:LOW QUALITY PROTEIN: uncharacterized protein LOC108101732 [Drosophila ficusphila]